MIEDTTDYKQIAYKLKSDIETKEWERNNSDLSFLKEIRDKLKNAQDKRDITLMEYGMQMINDWIDELTEKYENRN